MINFLKNYFNSKNEIKDISKKIKRINHKIITKLNINETTKLSNLNQKNRDKRI